MSDFREQFEQMQAMARGEDTTAGAVRQTMEGEMMKRERLEELREETTQYRAVANDRCMGTQYEDDLLALIDAEIARQSVTDDAVQDVAEASNEDIDWLIAYIGGGFGETWQWHESKRKILVSALRQYQFPSAIQWTGNNLREVIGLLGWNESASSKWTWEEYEQVVAEKGLKVFTPDGSVMAEIGDWIIENGKDCFVTRQYQKPKLCRLCSDEIDYEDVDLCSACINTLEITQASQYQKPTDEAPTVGDMHDYALRQMRTQWIPVSERLPESGNRQILVTGQDGEVDFAEYRYGEWESFGYQVEFTHWMPLPQPPESEV